jgi:hypothetical protein
MSRLEAKAQPLLKALITEQIRLGELHREEQELLARWSAKTAIIETRAVGAECPVDGKHLAVMRQHEDGRPGRFGVVGYASRFDAVGHLQCGAIFDLLGGSKVSGNIVALVFPRLILICLFPFNLPDVGYRLECDLSLFQPLWPGVRAWEPLSIQLEEFAGIDAGRDPLLALVERVGLLQ